MADTIAGRAGLSPRVASDGCEQTYRVRTSTLGAVPLLVVISALGLVAVAIGNNAARQGEQGAEMLFWIGIATIYGPTVYRLLSPAPSRLERIYLVVLLGLALFMVKVLYSPVRYPPFDELATWRQTHDLLLTGRPFSMNPIAAGFPGFPGLETVTAAVVRLADISIFHAGVIVIGVARAALMLCLFLLLERLVGSARSAGIGVAVYACNPSFLYFDSQFGHESLALTLGASLLLLVVIWTEPLQIDPDQNFGLIVAIVVVGASLTITHHMTSYAVASFLVLWALLTLMARYKSGADRPINTVHRGPGGAAPVPTRMPRTRPLSRGPVFAALMMCAMTVAWFIFVGGKSTIEELGGVLTNSADSVVRLIFGGSGPKTLFQGSSENNPAAARILAFASVIPLLALIPFGLVKTWRIRQPNPLWRALSIVAVLYPVTLGLRLTLSGTETSQRASEFVFVGVAFFAALLVGGLRLPTSRLRRRLTMAALAILGTIMFCGAFIVAELPTTRQPGPFLVGADARSVSAQGLAAARFAAENLPPNSRIIADRPNGTLLGSYGGLRPVLGRIDGVSVARVLFGRRFDEVDRTVLRDDEIAYIVVDIRLDRELPNLGFYLEPDEPGAFTRRQPLSRAALDKFASVPGLDRIYTNGPIAIYSTAGLVGS